MKPDRNADFDDWYRSEYPRVLAAVTVVCASSASQVEDATTDAFVKALERWATVSVMTSPTGWVTQVAINGAKRSFRRQKQHSAPVNSERITSVRMDPHRNSELIAALSKLSFRQRRAIVMHHVEGFTQAEVAADLGVAPGTASATLHQARRRLHSTLTDEEGQSHE